MAVMTGASAVIGLVTGCVLMVDETRLAVQSLEKRPRSGRQRRPFRNLDGSCLATQIFSCSFLAVPCCWFSRRAAVNSARWPCSRSPDHLSWKYIGRCGRNVHGSPERHMHEHNWLGDDGVRRRRSCQLRKLERRVCGVAAKKLKLFDTFPVGADIPGKPLAGALALKSWGPPCTAAKSIRCTSKISGSFPLSRFDRPTKMAKVLWKISLGSPESL